MDGPGNNSKGDHRHTRHQPVRYPVEGGGVANRHSPPRQPEDARRPPWVWCQKRDGAAIIELKLTQELLSIYQNPLLPVFLDLKRAYDTLDRERLFITLEGYGAGPHLCGLLETFWDYQRVVPRQNGFHRPAFLTTRGTIQGGLVSPTLFIVVVDNVIRTRLSMVVDDHRVAHDEMVKTFGRCVGVFYSDNGMVISHDPDWLHHATNVLAGLFRRYGLTDNVSKSCTMTCQTGVLPAGMLEDAMALKCTGVVESYRVRLRRHIPCPECGVEITAGSMTAYFCRMHGTEPAIDWVRLPFSQTEHQPQVYNVIFLRPKNRFPCPFPGFLGSSHTWNVLRSYFIRQHWGDSISILEEHPNPSPGASAAEDKSQRRG